MQFAFAGGAAQDPDGKPGVATFVSGMLDEGSGNLNSEGFQNRLEDLAAKFSVSASHDHMTVSVQMLTLNREESLKLLQTAINSPHFEAKDVERIREQIVANLRLEEKNPNKAASNEWFKLAFGHHAYGQPVNSTLESVAAITPADLPRYLKKDFARDNLKVAVVGDIGAEKLAERSTSFLALCRKIRPGAGARGCLGEGVQTARRPDAQSAIGRAVRI